MKFTKKQIEVSIEIVEAIDKAKNELGREFNEKTAASITYHIIYPNGREVTSLN